MIMTWQTLILKFICSNLGNILNIVGTVFVAISFGPYPKKEAAPYTTDSGSKRYIAYFNYPWMFYAGLFLLAVGFVFQLKFL